MSLGSTTGVQDNLSQSQKFAFYVQKLFSQQYLIEHDCVFEFHFPADIFSRIQPVALGQNEIILPSKKKLKNKQRSKESQKQGTTISNPSATTCL